MRIALLHPTYWPEVRRGSERLVHDLGVVLARRGHQVTLLTTHRGARSVGVEDGMRVVRARRLPDRSLRRVIDELYLGAAPAALVGALRGGYDLAHAFYPVDAFAAVAARRLGGPPVVFSFHGLPSRGYVEQGRRRLPILRAALRGASAVTVLSEAARNAFEQHLGYRPRVVPGGVLTESFTARVPKAERPTLLCAASLADPRKGAGVLFQAFDLLRRRRPDAELLLIGGRDPAQGAAPAAPPAGARWIEADDTAELARRYARAWASVLPGVDEAFGLVLLESLAAGTPVAASRSGACPEVVTTEAVGRLFDPRDPAAMARAMDEALELGRRPETAAACALHARRWDWSEVAPLHEELYREASR